MTEPINIAICFDEHMIVPAIVLISSIHEHADRERPIRVFAITTCTGVDLRSRFADRLGEKFDVIVMEVANRFTALSGNFYITQGTYLRLMIPELLSDLDKVLYLDSDIVVTRDLGSLYDLDLAGKFCAAAADASMSAGSRHQRGFKLYYNGKNHDFKSYVRDVVGLADVATNSYFNAGVMLMDLEACRSICLAERVVDFMDRRPNLLFMDQDALNKVLEGKYVALDERWNAIAYAVRPAASGIRRLFFRPDPYWERITELWQNDPWIVHYAGPTKPWNNLRPHQVMEQLWWRYARQSPIQDLAVSVTAVAEQ